MGNTTSPPPPPLFKFSLYNLVVVIPNLIIFVSLLCLFFCWGLYTVHLKIENIVKLTLQHGSPLSIALLVSILYL